MAFCFGILLRHAVTYSSVRQLLNIFGYSRVVAQKNKLDFFTFNHPKTTEIFMMKKDTASSSERETLNLLPVHHRYNNMLNKTP